MHQVEFIGCPSEVENSQKVEQSSKTKPTRQRKAAYCSTNSIASYRHYAVDTVNDLIIYFCDKAMYRDEAMNCFSSSDKGATWTGLPNYVQRIVGFSPAKGRMYLQDMSGSVYFSSKDGRRLDVVHSSSLPDMSSAEWQPSLTVPGENAKMSGMNWVGSTVVGAYGGIFVGGIKAVDWASCCRN